MSRTPKTLPPDVLPPPPPPPIGRIVLPCVGDGLLHPEEDVLAAVRAAGWIVIRP